MKIILLFILFINSFLINNVFGDDGEFGSEYGSCNYISEIEECNEANKNGNARSIEEFICLDSEYIKSEDTLSGEKNYRSNEEIVYQIVLDLKFKEVDDKIDKYLSELEKEKDKFFKKGGDLTYMDGVFEIEKKFANLGSFWYEYSDICYGNIDINSEGIITTNGTTPVINEVLKCTSGKSSNVFAKDYLYSAGSECMGLAETKLSISREVAYNILLLNKAQVEKDTKKEKVQEQRTKYDGLVNIMNINLGYMERIWQKWQFKIKNPM